MMNRLPACLVALTIGFAASGETLTVTWPQRGFERNLGQYASDVLFALDDRVFYGNRVQLATGLSLQFANANAAVAVSGQTPRGFPLNLYHGSDPKKWLENVPHFKTVHYAQVYPGIDVDFNTDRPPGGGTPFVRITVGPGADPAQVVMSLLADHTLEWFVDPSGFQTYSPYFALGGLAAYQSAAGSKSAVSAKFVQVNQNSFQPVLGSFDSSRPVVIEFGDPYCSCLSGSLIHIESDNSLDLAGAFYSSSWGSYAAKSLADGTPVFLSLFDSVRPSWLVADRKGGITVAGTLQFDSPWTAPVTPDAPLATPTNPPYNSYPDVWVGRFEATGRLVSSTYTGFGTSFALGTDGSVYFGTPLAVNQWVPGQPHFGFSTPVADVIAVATNQRGELAFAAKGSGGRTFYTTAGAVKSAYEGPWTEYVGKLNPTSGVILMATFVAVIGSTSPSFNVSTSLALAPGGALWLASDFQFFTTNAAGHTLVSISGDGTRVLDAEAVYGPANLAFDSGGNTLVILVSAVPNAPTSLDAAVSVSCGSGGWYFMKRGPDGSLLYASYLNVNAGGPVVTFDGAERLFILPYSYSSNIVHVDLTASAQLGIACFISPASRSALYTLAPGELVTITGYGLGPLRPAEATLDANGQLPLQLAGVQVLVHAVAMPLLSVQQGAITFYVPANAPNGSSVLQVLSGGVQVASESVGVGPVARFAVFTADGTGNGPVAGVNQDGTLNADVGAPGGSVVSIFGIGTTPLSSVYIDGGGPVVVEYAGPAPGLAPGVKQINLRLPKGWSLAGGTSFGRLYISPGAPGTYTSGQNILIRGCGVGLPCSSF